MAKTKNKNHREIEHLRGRVRKLEAELKYYKRLDKIEEEVPVEDVSCEVCEHCGKGLLQIFDFRFAELIKCDTCSWEKRRRKK